MGAGFDALAFELHEEFVDVRFWEVDHPATQDRKKFIVHSAEAKGIDFIASDLSLSGLDGESLRARGFDPGRRTLWIAEGVLMYFPARSIQRLLEQMREMSAGDSRVVFTFMERDAKGRIRFRKQTALVDWWLRWRGESFRWGIETENVARFISPLRVRRVYGDNDLRKLGPADGEKTLAAGELICLAEF